MFITVKTMDAIIALMITNGINPANTLIPNVESLGLLICWLNKFRLTHQVHIEIPIKIKKERSAYRIIGKGKSNGSCKDPKLLILVLILIKK